MKSYILSVIAVAALGSIALGICPEGEGQGIKKTFSLIMSLLLVVAVGKPLITLIGSFNTDSLMERFTYKEASYDAVWQSTLANVTKENANSAVSEIIMEKFGLDGDEFSSECEIVSEENAYKIDKITVELYGAGLLQNPRRIEQYLSEAFGCECTVN